MADLQWDRAFALEQVGEDEELLKELLEVFHDASASDLNKIKEGVQQSDLEAVGDAAHSIKGASASLGIEGIRAVAAELERAGRSGDEILSRTLLPQLEQLLAACRGLDLA